MLNKNVSLLKGIGPKTTNHLNEKGIFSIKDLLLFSPKEYVIYELADLRYITSNGAICVNGYISSCIIMRKFRSSVNSIIFTLSTEFYDIKVLVFGQDFWRFKLTKGQNITIYGNYRCNEKELIAKEIILDFSGFKIETKYDLEIPNKTVTKIINDIYLGYSPIIDDILPNYLIEKYRLLSFQDYVKVSHFPTTKNDIKQINRRKKFEKYLLMCLSFECVRYYYDSTTGNSKIYNEGLIDSFIKKLPYELTSDQLKAIDTMLDEMKSVNIMNRLIQGDVGSGKSIVALIVALANVSANYQVVIMAPTEILAMQHYNYFLNLLNDYKVQVALLTSSTKSKDKNLILDRLESNRINILIGTHSLIEEKVKFNNLGLVIIDEQHRFGVLERSKLINKGTKVDSMFLTATPIPRTLGIARFGDLDISSIRTKPMGRKKVITKVVKTSQINKIIKTIEENHLKGHQTFVIVPLINESDKIQAMDVISCYELLSSKLKSLKINYIHGGLKSNEKDNIMTEFKNNKIDVLVSTTVIEVGVDIKNATLMVIFNAERFGLSQLHQLRGRVGRNELECKCLLVSDNEYCKRLEVLEECDDCFSLSDEDLKLRGPGDFLGEKQSGFLEEDISDNINIYECAKNDAKELYHKYLYTDEKYPIVQELITRINNDKIKFN